MTTTTKTTEYGVMFKDEMVRAILAGRKTQTRRAVQEVHEHTSDTVTAFGNPVTWMANRRGVVEEGLARLKPPHGVVGGKLYAKECWAQLGGAEPSYAYRSDSPNPEAWRWNSSMFMPARAARIWLRTTALRLERLSDVTGDDCIAEGVTWECATCKGTGLDPTGLLRRCTPCLLEPRRAYMKLIASIHDKKPGDNIVKADPWMWVYTFERLEGRHG